MKQRLSLSLDERRARYLQRCADRRTSGNASAYLDDLLAREKLREAVSSAADWYDRHPGYAKDAIAENEAALGETA